MDIEARLGSAGKALLGAWNALPKRDFVADRAAFDPFVIARIMPLLSLIETSGGTDWRVRLAGTEIDRRNGFPLTGRDVLALVREDVRPLYAATFAAVIGRPCGSWEIQRLALSSGRISLVEAVRLPLRAADGRVRLIVSSSEELSAGAAGAASRRDELAVDGVCLVLPPADGAFFDIGAGVPDPIAPS